MAFNLMEIMNSSSQASNILKYEPAEIDIENICANPANNIYNTEDIDKLAESIELAGRVLQNLVVKEADSEGHYMIISGHRRWLACRKLVEGGNEQYRTLPCLIEHEHDDLLQELMLIYSNSTIRVLTDAEKMRQASRATEICRKLKEENRLEGRVRDIVAEMLNESATQLARYSAIDKGLTNEILRAAFEEGNIGVSVAYEAARLDEEGQAHLAKKVEKVGVASIRNIVEWQKQREIEQAAEKTAYGLPMEKEYKVKIKPKFKASLTIEYVERDGKFYSGFSYNVPKGGGGSPISDTPYDNSQLAIEGGMKEAAERSKYLHKALWESGFAIIGKPEEAEPEAPKPHSNFMTERFPEAGNQAEEQATEKEKTKVEAARAKMKKEGYSALTDCEKCKITTDCEDCCRTCPPEKHCNVHQCRIENRAEDATGFNPQKPGMRSRGELLQIAISDVEKKLENLSKTSAALAKFNEGDNKEELAIIEKMKVDCYNRLLGLIRQEQTTIG